MTTVKSPTIFESAPDAESNRPTNGPDKYDTLAHDTPADTGPEATNDELTALLRACIEEGTGRYVELDVGGLDELSIEPFLYRLLGVADTSEVLLGVSSANYGDLEYCREEHGEPQYRVTLAAGAHSALDWYIWRAPATALWSGSLAGASLVLPARDPGWVILTHPARGNPWLFPTHS